MSCRASTWAHRLALGTAGATVVLIVAGGLVTNTGSALAVPDWPTTFGRNMLLYPWSEMVGGVLYEHSHRLLGALVGVLTLGLAVALWMTAPQGWLRALGVAALILVSVQGLLGGLRVVLLQDGLAIFHGALAQAFFALTVAVCVFTSRGWVAPVAPLPAGEAQRLFGLSLAMTLAVYGQIVLGALTTHAGWVLAHLGGAVVVVVLTAALIGRVLGRHPDRRVVVWLARAVGGLLAVQVVLGVGAYVARLTGGLGLPGGAVSVLALPVAHRVTGALVLGAALALTLHLWRLHRAAGVVSGWAAQAGVPGTRSEAPA